MKFTAVETGHAAFSTGAQHSSYFNVKSKRLLEEKKAFVQVCTQQYEEILQCLKAGNFEKAHKLVVECKAQTFFHSKVYTKESIDLCILALKRLVCKAEAACFEGRQQWVQSIEALLSEKSEAAAAFDDRETKSSFFWSKVARLALRARHLKLARLGLEASASIRPTLYNQRLQYFLNRLFGFQRGRSSGDAMLQRPVSAADKALVDQLFLQEENATETEASESLMPQVMLEVQAYERMADFLAKIEDTCGDLSEGVPSVWIRIFAVPAAADSASKQPADGSGPAVCAAASGKSRRGSEPSEQQSPFAGAVSEMVAELRDASQYKDLFENPDSASAPPAPASPSNQEVQLLHVAGFLPQAVLGYSRLMETIVVHLLQDAFWFDAGPFFDNDDDLRLGITLLLRAVVSTATADQQWPFNHVECLASACVLCFEYFLLDNPEHHLLQSSQFLFDRLYDFMHAFVPKPCSYLMPLVNFAHCYMKNKPFDHLEDFQIRLKNSFSFKTASKKNLENLRHLSEIRRALIKSVFIPLHQASSKEYSISLSAEDQKTVLALDLAGIMYFKEHSFLILMLKCKELLKMCEIAAVEKLIADFFVAAKVAIWAVKKHNFYFMNLILQAVVDFVGSKEALDYVPSFDFCRLLCSALDEFGAFSCAEAKSLFVSMLSIVVACVKVASEDLVSKIHSFLATFRICLVDKGYLLATLLSRLPLDAVEGVTKGPVLNCIKCLFRFQYSLKPWASTAEHYEDYETGEVAKSLLAAAPTKDFIMKLYCEQLKGEFRRVGPSVKDLRQGDLKRISDYIKKTFLEKSFLQPQSHYCVAVSHDCFSRFVGSDWVANDALPVKYRTRTFCGQQEAFASSAALYHFMGKISSCLYRVSKSKCNLYENDFVRFYETSQLIRPTAHGWHTLAHTYHDMAISYCTSQQSPLFIKESLAQISGLFCRSINCFDALHQVCTPSHPNACPKSSHEYCKYDEKIVLNYFYYLFLAKALPHVSSDLAAVKEKCLNRLGAYFERHRAACLKSWRALFWRGYLGEKQSDQLLVAVELYLFSLVQVRKRSRNSDDKSFPVVYKIVSLLYKATRAGQLSEAAAREILTEHDLLGSAPAKQHAGLTPFHNACVAALLVLGATADRKKTPEHRAIMAAAQIDYDQWAFAAAIDILDRVVQVKKKSLNVNIWKNSMQLYFKHHKYVQKFCVLYAKCVAAYFASASSSSTSSTREPSKSIIEQDRLLALVHKSAHEITIFSQRLVERCTQVLCASQPTLR